MILSEPDCSSPFYLPTMTRTKTPYLPTYCGRQSPGSVPHLPTYSKRREFKFLFPGRAANEAKKYLLALCE